MSAVKRIYEALMSIRFSPIQLCAIKHLDLHYFKDTQFDSEELHSREVHLQTVNQFFTNNENVCRNPSFYEIIFLLSHSFSRREMIHKTLPCTVFTTKPGHIVNHLALLLCATFCGCEMLWYILAPRYCCFTDFSSMHRSNLCVTSASDSSKQIAICAGYTSQFFLEASQV